MGNKRPHLINKILPPTNYSVPSEISKMLMAQQETDRHRIKLVGRLNVPFSGY